MSINYRYELKYTFDDYCLADVENSILNHPSMFREIYEERSIHNIYLDGADLHNFYDNLYGVKDRVKHRIRWYNSNVTASNPALEYKYKSNKLGWKEFYSMPDFRLDNRFSWGDYLEKVKNHFDKNKINDVVYNDISAEYPALLNSYKRRYYESHCGKFRFTIDYDLKYMRIDDKVSQCVPFTDNRMILELKYDEDDADASKAIILPLSFSLSSNSKYTNGVNLVRFSGIY